VRKIAMDQQQMVKSALAMETLLKEIDLKDQMEFALFIDKNGE
jgi:hypothetical protein